MLLKRLLLTPLLFIQMWVGFGIVHDDSIFVKQTSSALTIDMPEISVYKAPEQAHKDLIAIYLASLLVWVLYFSLNNTKFNKIKNAINIIEKHIKNMFFNRVLSKTKAAYYLNFHSLMNSIKSI